VSYTVADFNNDSKSDMIITNAGGSYWYYSTGRGSWNQAYTRSDLVIGGVSYVTGDFDGDAKSDFVVSNSSGSYWYYSTGTGTWNTAYTRTDLPVGKVHFTAADFDGHGIGNAKTDLIIQTWDGSYWYYSTGLGTWNQAYVRTDLPIGKALYQTGNFDGDSPQDKRDMIITTSGGSYWYYSTGIGTWNNTAYTRTDLPL
jgi:hypothetical protein